MHQPLFSLFISGFTNLYLFIYFAPFPGSSLMSRVCAYQALEALVPG